VSALIYLRFQRVPDVGSAGSPLFGPSVCATHSVAAVAIGQQLCKGNCRATAPQIR